MGSAIVAECVRRGLHWTQGRRECVGYVMNQLAAADLAINAAAYVPLPTVDACKNDPDATILGNVMWPAILRDACFVHGIPMVQLSTACLFDEAREYTETDPPTRGWNGYCGTYVGSKRLGEKVVIEYEKHYILRLRLPFDEVDHPRNYLSKLASFERVFEHQNSLTHRGDFAKWALDLWEKKASFGTYHMVNTGQIHATGMVITMSGRGLIPKMPEFVKSPDTTGARLSNDKLVAAIGPVRDVYEAVAQSIANWRKA